MVFNLKFFLFFCLVNYCLLTIANGANNSTKIVNSHETDEHSDHDSEEFEEEDDNDSDDDDHMPTIECRTNVTVEDSFNENGLTTDLKLNLTEYHLALAVVEYKDGKKLICGNELTPNETSEQPIIFDYPGGWYENYTVLMIDPDATSRANPEFRSLLHWMVINVPGNNITAGQVAAKYLGPDPPPKSGLHRYVFLVYLQSEQLELKDLSDNRKNFDVNKWANETGSTGPYFANLFQAQNELTKNSTSKAT